MNDDDIQDAAGTPDIVDTGDTIIDIVRMKADFIVGVRRAKEEERELPSPGNDFNYQPPYGHRR